MSLFSVSLSRVGKGSGGGGRGGAVLCDSFKASKSGFYVFLPPYSDGTFCNLATSKDVLSLEEKQNNYKMM